MSDTPNATADLAELFAMIARRDPTVAADLFDTEAFGERAARVYAALGGSPQQRVNRIMDEARRQVAPIVRAEAEGERISSEVMDMRLRSPQTDAPEPTPSLTLPPAQQRNYVGAVQYALDELELHHHDDTNGMADLRCLRDWLAALPTRFSAPEPTRVTRVCDETYRRLRVFCVDANLMDGYDWLALVQRSLPEIGSPPASSESGAPPDTIPLACVRCGTMLDPDKPLVYVFGFPLRFACIQCPVASEKPVAHVGLSPLSASLSPAPTPQSP